MSQDPSRSADPPSSDVAGQSRPEQHGPEMDDTQVEATGRLRDELDPVTPDADTATDTDADTHAHDGGPDRSPDAEH